VSGGEPMVRKGPGTMGKVRYEEMLPHEIVAARTARPVAYVPLGLVEWHGQQNAVGLDGLKQYALAIKCAEEHGGLVMPTLFFGEPRESELMEANYDPDGRIVGTMGLPPGNFMPGYMHTLKLQEHLRYTRLLVHVLFQMESLGFQVIVLWAGHAPLLPLAKAAVYTYEVEIRDRCLRADRAEAGARERSLRQRAGPRPHAWATFGDELILDEIAHVGDHAAAWETSMMMALRPELVDLGRLPKEGGEEALIGIWGRDPRKFASREFGQQCVEAILRRVGERVKSLLADRAG